MPDVVELSAGRERAHGRVVGWTGGSTQLQCATVQIENRLTVHLVMEELGETGWDWHVWVQDGRNWARYGLAETAENAKEQAEQALVGLMRSEAGRLVRAHGLKPEALIKPGEAALSTTQSF